jgi:probable O-glycosylation ligase (exosortase A-associated)
LIPVGTSTRTGLLCIGLVALLMLRDAKRKLLYLGLLGAMGVLAVPFLPSSFTNRMSTIKTYKGDESASTRLAVWGWTWEYAKEHPLGGGFEMYRQNKIRYDTEKVEGDASNATVDRKLTVDQARAFHSAYFEMLGEQGFPGLAIWVLINLTGIIRMEVLRHRYRKQAEYAWVTPLAGALQSAHIVYLLGAAFIAIAFQPFVYMLIGAQIGLDTYLARKRRAAAWRPIRKPRPEAVVA